MALQQKLVILDRDGVINLDSDQYIKSAEEWVPIESSLRAIAALNRAGYKVAVATNQSGIARGYFDTLTLTMMHKKMELALANYGGHIDAIEFCSDHPDNPGPNRKPNPGMLTRLIKQFSANTHETWFVGDSLSDIKCANNANCKPALVLTGKGRETAKITELSKSLSVFSNLEAFVKHLTNSTK